MRQLTAVLFVLVLLSAAAMVATTRRHTYGQGGELSMQVPYLDYIWFTGTGLLMLWAAIGGGLLRMRLAGSAMCLAVLLMVVNAFGEYPGYWAALERTAYQGVTFVGVLSIIAWSGVRVRISRPLGNSNQSPPPGRPHWTVWDLLATVAVAALLLATIRNLRPVPAQWPFMTCVRLVEGVLFALLAFAAAWVSLGNAGIHYRLAGFLAAVSLLIVTEGFSVRFLFLLCFGRPYPASWQLDIPGWSERFGLQGLLMAASLWVFRAYGYRLVCWRRQQDEQPRKVV